MRLAPTGIEFSNLRLYDEVDGPSVTSATLAFSNSGALHADCTAASGLTQFRAYTLYAQAAGVGFIGFSAEL